MKLNKLMMLTLTALENSCTMEFNSIKLCKKKLNIFFFQNSSTHQIEYVIVDGSIKYLFLKYDLVPPKR